MNNWQQSFSHLNEILHALGIDNYMTVIDYNMVKLRMCPCDIILLDEELLRRKLYVDGQTSMQEYVESKLTTDQYNHFNILFLGKQND